MYQIRAIKSLFSYEQEIAKSKTYPVCFLKAAPKNWGYKGMIGSIVSRFVSNSFK